MATAREVDDNGFLTIRGCPISSFGVFDYGAGQLGLPGDPGRIVKVYRPESAVNNQATMDSFKNVPLINDHEMLSGSSDKNGTAPEDYGVSGILTSNVYYASPWMSGDIKIFSREMQADLSSGKKDLSLGYSCKFEVKPGVFEGQPYEVVQTDLLGNHIALVGEGRVPGARVLDGLCFDHLRFDVIPSDKETNIMVKKVASKKAAMDNAVEQLQALLPALQQFLNEEATEPAHQGGESAGETTDPNTDAVEASVPDPAAAPADPDAPAAAGGLPALIQNVEAVLAQLKGMTASADPDPDASNDPDPVVDDGEMVEDDLSEMAATTPPINKAIKDQGVEEGQGKASPGPSAGKHTGADAAFATIYADMAQKVKTYERLSKVVGAFDNASMTSKDINVYGVKKLGLKCPTGHEHFALDAYLTGIEAANKVTKQKTNATVGDSAVKSPELDAYLKGSK